MGRARACLEICPKGEKSMTLDMFAKREPETIAQPEQTLRPYQLEAVTRIQDELKENRSTLLVAATGTGKTQIFSEVVRRWNGRCLVLAHRDELIQQASRRLSQYTGRQVDVEQADAVAYVRGKDTVVASVQTLSRAGRLNRFPVDAFGLVVVDEAHHAPAETYRRILDHFSAAKVVGVTATPDRADRMALGQTFDSVAYVYDIEDAIRDGWLCPIRVTMVQLDTLDVAGVRTTAGDLNQGDLDAVMAIEENLHGVVTPTMELAEKRRTLVFTTSVHNAHRMAEIFNRHRPECARAVDGGTPPDERRRIFSDHQEGRFQFLVNVGIATEGYDDPAISCVVMGRPTKSRALYAQMAGRGTRIMPGKSDLLILDFVGNAGRHALVTAHNILAGRHPEDVVERAKRIAKKKPGMDVKQALDEAEAELAAEKRRAVRAKVNYRTREVDPFAVLDVDKSDFERFEGEFGKKMPTDKQIETLGKFKVPIPEGLSRRGASKLLDQIFKRLDEGACSFKQAAILLKYGYDTNVSFQTASGIIDALAKNRWKRPPDMPEPGWNG